MSTSLPLTEKQKKIYDWMVNINQQAYADLFHGAAVLFNSRSEGYLSLVAHAAREIMWGLADSFRGSRDTNENHNRYDYFNGAEKIKEVWIDKNIEKIENIKNNSISYKITKSVYNTVEDLLDGHKGASDRSDNIDALFFQTFFCYPNEKSVNPYQLKEWKDARDWFTGIAHMGYIKSNIEEYENKMKNYFKFLEDNLLSCGSSVFKILEKIDEILETANGRAS